MPPITIPSGVPGIGGQTLFGDTPPPAAADDSQRQAIIAALTAKYGAPYGTPAPQFVQGTGTQQGNKYPTGFDQYTFGDGTTAEISPTGQLQNLKPSTTATRAPTDQQALAQQGILLVGNQIYTKNPTPDDGRGPYVPSTAAMAQQQLADAKTVADTQAQAALAAKNKADADYAADPNNIMTKQAKDVADARYTQAQAAATTSNAAATALNAQSSALNAQTTASKAPSEIQLTTAQAAGTAATTAKTLATTPYDVQAAQIAAQQAAANLANDPQNTALKQANTQAQTAYQDALAKSTAAKAAEPTVWATGTTAPTTTYYDPTTGTIQDRPNTSYLPTDPGRMQQQLNDQATAQYQALQQQVVAGKLTPDQASSQFDQWWNANAEPIKSDIASAQAKAQSAIQQQQAQAQLYQAQAANYPATLAQTASNDAQSRAISMMPYLVNKSAATTPGVVAGGAGHGFPSVNPQQIMQNATFSVPNLQEIGRMGAAQALAAFSPTAQAHLQAGPQPAAPPVGGLPDLSSLMNRNNFSFGPPGGGAPPAQVGPTPDQLQAQQAAGQGVTNIGAFAGTMPWGGGAPPMPWQQSAPNFGNPQLSAMWGQYQPGG